MAVKFNLRKCLKLIDSGLSANDISRHHHISKASTSKTKKRKEELEFDISTLDQYSDEELCRMFFPESYASDDIYVEIDYDYVHNELSKTGVTLKLLWKEYCAKAPDDKCTVSYTTFCRGYEDYVDQTKFTNRIDHKPGVRTEVDWSGSHMSYTVPATGEVVTVYLFVATLPFSQYTYVEATKDMKMNTWIKCNRHMFEFFGGSTIRVVCDNLKTGVVSHPKEGDIILTDTYSDFGEHYMTAIMPAQVRKPKQKPSVEGSVGKIATAIIAELRNEKFTSYEELVKAVREKLEIFNTTEFQKREGSRKLVFDEVEKDTLRTLPDIPFEVSTWYYGRKIGLNSHILFKKNYYSVPYTLYPGRIDIKVGEETLTTYLDNKRINIHKLFPSYCVGKYSTYECDMPDSVKFTEFDDVRIKKWAQKCGDNVGEVVQRVFDSCKIKEQAYNPSISIIKLGKTYGYERLNAACEIALRSFVSPRYKHIKAILASNQDVKEENKPKEVEPLGHIRGADFYGGKK